MLHFKKAGSGPPLVMLHGLFGSLENLGGIARFLSERFTVFSLDLPDHGRSCHLSQASLEIYADQIKLWLDQQDLQQVNLLGHSLGGKIAMELALTNPEYVEKLVVLDISPVAYGARHNDVFDGLGAIDLGKTQSRTDANLAMSQFVSEEAVRTFLLKNLSRGESGFAWRMNLPGLKSGYPELIKANRAGQFGGPVLFLKGGASNYINPEHSEQVYARFPSSSLRIVGDAAHWLHAEKPHLVARLVERFLTTGA